MSYLKFAKNIFAVGFLDLLGMISGLVFLSLMTKILGAEDYGIWSQIKITMSLAVSFTFFGLQEALIRFIPSYSDEKIIRESIFSSVSLVLFINLIIALFLMIFANYVSLILKFSPVFVKMLSLIIIFESLSVAFLVVVRSIGEIGKYFWFMVAKMILEILFVSLAVFLDYGLLGAVIAYLLVRVGIFSVLFIYIVKKIGLAIPEFSLIKKYLKFGLPTVADGLSYWLITSSDRYLIGFFLGIVFVGYYVPAYSIGYLLSVFIFPLSIVLSLVLPKFFDENEIEKVKNYLKHSLKYFLAIIIPSLVGISVLSKELLLIFSNEEIATKSYFIVPLLASSIFFYGTTYFFSQILVLAKKTKTIAWIWIMAAFLNLSLNMIFISALGILGAAITTFLAYFLALILMRHFAFKEFRFDIEWVFIAKIYVASLVMGISIFLLNLTGFWGLIMMILIGIIIYLLSATLLGCLGKKEIIFLKNLICEPR